MLGEAELPLQSQRNQRCSHDKAIMSDGVSGTLSQYVDL